MALAGRRRDVVLAGEAKWSRSVDGPRLLLALQRKSAHVAHDPDALTYVLAARETVRDLPPGAVAVTAREIFAPM
ncbi:hypothetical protein BH23ACT10_BH23ACT10_23920 [soil metagenome]